VRGDGRGLSHVFDEIVFNMPILEAIQSGWLCDLRAFRVKTRVDLDQVRAYPSGDFVETELDSAVNTDVRNELIVKTWCEYGQPRQTIVFCVTIQHGQALAGAFKAAGVKADCVWGNDPERKAKIERHKAGEITVLTNCGILTEGYDDWRIGCVLLARPTKSELLFMQMIGRGTRIDNGIDNLVVARRENLTISKPDCVVIDVVDNSREHRLVTMATIFGFDVDHDLRGQSVSRAGRKVHTNATGVPRLISPDSVSVITTEVEEVDLFAPKWTDGLLNRSVLQWFRRGNSFVLPLPGKEDISIEYSLTWVARGVIGGQRFRKEGFSSFAEARAYGEAMSNYLGKPLRERIVVEEQLVSITPIQEDLLRSAGENSWGAAITRDEAAIRITVAYQRELDALCVSPLPAEEDRHAHGKPIAGPLDSAAISKSVVFPELWKERAMNHCVLRWYRTDDGGYAMPLPESGELVLLPSGPDWLASGEICGEKVIRKLHNSLKEAFKYLETLIGQVGGDILAAAVAEQDWASHDPTPLQMALLTNLLGTLEANTVKTLEEAQLLIESLYPFEFDPTADTIGESDDDYAEQSLVRFRLDLNSIHTSIKAKNRRDFDV
jgi:hypothetical protein